MKLSYTLFSLLIMACIGGHAHADVSSGTKYRLSGAVSGYLSDTGGKCYIAITDSSRYYSDGYHLIDDKQMCQLARSIYMLRGKISAVAEVRYDMDTNRITDLEATRGGTPYWPPYHGGNNVAHYALIGQVNGYLLIAKNSSCYVSIKGNAAMSNGYHEVKDHALCVVLLGAYLEGAVVTTSAEKSWPGYPNLVTSAELSESPKVHWPPYGKK